jgi:hypothetical protein
MIRVINWKEYLSVSAALAVLSLIHWSDPFLNLLWGLLFLAVNALIYGNWLFLKAGITYKFLIGLLFEMAVASLVGTACFYLFYLNDSAFAAIIISIPLIGLILIAHKPVVLETLPKISFKPNFKILFLTACYLILMAAIFYLTFKGSTVQNIRSPWETVSSKIFLLYFLATFCLYNILNFSKSKAGLLLISLHFFLSFSIAMIVYRIGFDYDPFIHRANENILLQTGTLLPKPFYYIGQYSLVIFLHKLLLIPLDWLDRLLVPLLSAVYLPLIIYNAFKDNFKVLAKITSLIILTLLGLTYANFISTTPQSLADLILIISIFLSLYYLEHPSGAFWPLLILSLFALSIHPLAGIPCFFFIILVLTYHYFQKKIPLPKMLHRGIFWEIAAVACMALPLAFWLNSLTSSQLKIGINQSIFQNLTSLLNSHDWTVFYRPFISIYDLVYTYGKNIIFIAIIAAIIGLIHLVRNEKFKTHFIYPLFSGIMVVNYLIIALIISFSSLIAYEQGSYTDRILKMSVYFLLPFIIIALYQVFTRLFEQKKIFIFLTYFLLSLALTCSFYLSYPRVDKYEESHGYSTSLSDIKTVNFIERQSANQPYVVLAPQNISAAAIGQLGYKYYYDGLFFYPVPTGGRLYEYFDKMAYNKDNTSDIISTVRYLTGVNNVYFVLNDYWLDSQKIISEQKNQSDEWYQIDNKNFIFRYTK